MLRIRCITLALVIAATAPVVPARSEPWPQRAVRIILPLAAGGATDIAARLLAERLSQRWSQPVIVENRQGADGIVAVMGLVNARDDHTLLFSFAAPISINPFVHDKLPYDPALDLVPIAPAIDNFFAIGVTRSLGVDSMTQFVERARRAPGVLNWTASAGLPQYIFAALAKSARLEITYVSYRDFTQAVQDFGEGRVHVAATGLLPLLPHVQAGRAKLLMVTNRERSPLVPDVPTATEVGYPELLFEGVVGFFGWRNMPSDLRDRIAIDVRAAASDPALAARLKEIAVAVRTGTPAEFNFAIEAQRHKVAAIIRGSTRRSDQ
jgi:tripartite-type tricarboxylate transporter receptor subunit TctC